MDSLYASEMMLTLAVSMFCLKLAGLLILEAGFVRGKNRVHVSIKKLVKFVIALISFSFLGSFILFRSNLGLFIPPLEYLDNPDYVRRFIVHCFIPTTLVTLVSGAGAERMSTHIYFILTAAIAGIFYPLIAFGFWADSFGGDLPWLKSLGFYDFAGVNLLHCLAGSMALAVTCALGPRIGRFGKNQVEMRSNDPTFSFLGVGFLWIGWYGYLYCSSFNSTNVSIINLFAKSLFAGSCGAFASVSFDYIASKKRFFVYPCIVGVIGGLCAGSPGLDQLSTMPLMIISSLGGLVACLGVRLTQHLKIDDVTETIAAHLLPTIVGSIMMVFFLDETSSIALASKPIGERILIQLAGCLFISITGFLSVYVFLILLNKIMPIRVSKEAESLGLSISEHGASTEASELLNAMQNQIESKTFASDLNLTSNSEISRIGSKYNDVLKQLASVTEQEKKLRSRLEQSNLKLSIQRDIMRQVNLAPSIEEGLGLILPKVLKAYKYTGVRVSMLQDGAKQILGSAWIYNRELTVNSEFEGAFNEGPWNLICPTLGEFAHSFSNKHLTIDNTPEFKKYDIRSGLLLPILQKNELIGIVEIYSHLDLSSELFECPLEDSLIRSITERITSDNHSNALREALEKAEDNNKAQSEFLAMMSHEIRTPMNGVLGTCGLLLNSELSSAQEEFAYAIKDSAESLLFVINDILDFSKYKSGSFTLNEHDFNLEELVESAFNDIKARVKAKGIEFVLSIDMSIPKVLHGDSTRLKQILLNILSNAVKFTHKGEITLTVSQHKKKQGKHDLSFEISDTGIGIPKKSIPTLFESFRQVDGSSTRQYGGTGLGLAICKRLVEFMDGKISVSSAEGKGSVFTFNVLIQEAVDKKILANRMQSEQRLIDKVKGKTVLLHIFNITSEILIIRQLKRWGMKVETLSNPKNIEESIKSYSHIDYIILGFRPRQLDSKHNTTSISGIEIAFQFRKLERLNETPIVLYSSYTKQFLLEEIGDRENPVTHFVEKPMIPSNFLFTLTRLDKHTQEQGNTSLQLQKVTKQRKVIHGNVSFARRYPINILLVDDNAINRRLAIAILEGWGYVPDVVNNGREALKAASKTYYDVILMDVEMPVMDGITAVGEIRKLPKPYCESHIFAVTAGAMPGDRERCLKAGMDEYVTKPLVSEEMLRIFLKFRSHWGKATLDKTRQAKGIQTKPDVIDLPNLQKNKQPPSQTIIENDGFFDTNLTELKKLIGEDYQQQLDFIDPFVGELENYRISIKQDLSELKVDSVRRAFHSLKTNCKIFGSLELSAICAELEELSKAEKVETISHKLNEFLDLLDRFKVLLEESSANLNSKL